MQIAFDLWNLSLWLAVTCCILLITAQLASVYEGRATVLINLKRLKAAALVMAALFLLTGAMRFYGIMA